MFVEGRRGVDLKTEAVDYILQMKNITKSFGSLMANENVCLNVRRGSVHALIGENGAGKSTLMNILTSIYKPDSGDIILNGEKVVFKDSLDAANHGIGMVYQEFMLFPDLTVLENIMMGFEAKKAGIFVDKKKTRNRIEQICNQYNFNIPLDDKIKNLPVSMLQQVEIVKVLYKKAELIILDEPTSVLTPQGIQGLFEAIRFLTSKGKTVIFITHKLKEVFAIADDITVLKDGRIVGNVKPSDVGEEEIANMMVGRQVILKANKVEHDLGRVILEAKNIVIKDSAGVERVKNVSLTIREGEIVGIAGVAGSGQQQIVEAIFGLQDIEPGGQIIFDGQDITKMNCRERRKLGIGYVPQDRLKAGSNPGATIWETAIMGYHVAHGFKNHYLLDHKEIKTFTEDVVKEYQVKTRGIQEKVRNLSGGNIQKLIVGREFIQKNKLLIIEDPTRGIDVGAIEFIWEKIIRLSKAGVAVLVVSHELNEVLQLSDRVQVVFDGKISDGGAYQEHTPEEIGILMMGGTL